MVSEDTILENGYERMTDLEKVFWLTKQVDWIQAEFDKIRGRASQVAPEQERSELDKFEKDVCSGYNATLNN